MSFGMYTPSPKKPTEPPSPPEEEKVYEWLVCPKCEAAKCAETTDTDRRKCCLEVPCISSLELFHTAAVARKTLKTNPQSPVVLEKVTYLLKILVDAINKPEEVEKC